NDYVADVDSRTGIPFRTQLVKREKPLPGEAFRDAENPTGIGTDQGEPMATIEGAPSTLDLLSALFRLRALPLAPGAEFDFTAEHQGTRYDARLRVRGRETVKTPAGSFDTLATELSIRNDEQVDDYRIRVYFSEDERHVPVMITARHSAGEVRAVLASSEFVEVQPAAEMPSPQIAQNPTPRPAPVAARNSFAALPLAALPFSVGEELVFNFFLGASTQPVGKAVFQVRSRANYFNRDGLLLSANMYTTGAAQRLFPVRDKIDTYVDAKSLLPFRSQLQISEGSHRLEGVVSFEQERGTAVTTDNRQIEIPVGTHDLVSVLYALRSFDLTPPKRNAVSLFINKRPRTLSITALSRAEIELGGKRIPAIQLSLVTDDPQGDRLGLRLWVSADRHRLPLRLTATTPLGPVRADLAIIPLDRQ
ncbi:MAG: DUF3108 domain-containing protein, partial [Pyrinomonadaceae bacterium]